MTAAAPMPGLHGREAETGAVNRALDQAASGRLAVVPAEGEAGIGKTRLLAGTLTTARRATCAESETSASVCTYPVARSRPTSLTSS